jgi:SAM-dependent methyltransferase
VSTWTEEDVRVGTDGLRADMAVVQLTRPARDLSRVQARYRKRVVDRLASGEYHLEDVALCQCGSADAERVSSADRFGLPVGVVMCLSCGLLRTTPRLAAADLPAFYRDDYHGLHMGIERPDPETSLFSRGQGAQVYRYLRHRLEGSSTRIAEVGAGTGSVLREFADAARHDGLATELVGCEYATALVEAGRSVGTDIRQGGLEALHGIEPPDVLILSHVLEHFADPAVELEAIRRLVSPRSLVYVEVPGLLAIHRKPQYDYSFRAYVTLAHTYHFSRATLIQTLRRGGFKLLSGDELVRSAFVVDPGLGPPAPEPGLADRHREYLAWLESAPSVRARRAALRGRRRLRRAIRAGARAVLGRTAGQE